MNIRGIKKLPKPASRHAKTNNNQIQTLLLDFYNSSDDFAEVEFDHGEYTSSLSLYSGVKKAIQALNLPINAVMIRGGVYLERRE